MELEVNQIYKSFSGNEVLHGVSFKVTSGRALGLLGRNGAGKTTTIRIIMNVFHATRGEILLDGKPFKPAGQRIGYLPEERGLYPKRTVMDQLLFLAKLRGMKATEAKSNAKKWLTRLEVWEYAARKLETLSKGNQQKVQLAATLVCDPMIVILDEPFSGLDPVNAQILKDVVQPSDELCGRILRQYRHYQPWGSRTCRRFKGNKKRIWKKPDDSFRRKLQHRRTGTKN